MTDAALLEVHKDVIEEIKKKMFHECGVTGFIHKPACDIFLLVAKKLIPEPTDCYKCKHHGIIYYSNGEVDRHHCMLKYMEELYEHDEGICCLDFEPKEGEKNG